MADRGKRYLEARSRIDRETTYTPAQTVFRFAVQAGILPLTGTTNALHMREDLDIGDFSLSDEEMRAIETLAM